jgi:hypothetical protein
MPEQTSDWSGGVEAVAGNPPASSDGVAWMESGKSGMIPNNRCGCSTCAEKFENLEGGEGERWNLERGKSSLIYT